MLALIPVDITAVSWKSCLSPPSSIYRTRKVTRYGDAGKTQSTSLQAIDLYAPTSKLKYIMPSSTPPSLGSQVQTPNAPRHHPVNSLLGFRAGIGGGVSSSLQLCRWVCSGADAQRWCSGLNGWTLSVSLKPKSGPNLSAENIVDD